MNYREEAYLMHYGVLGMKWGQRRVARAERGAATIRKVGGAYANSMANKASRTQQESNRRIADAKSGEAAIRKHLPKSKLTDAYANSMANKAKRIQKQTNERVAKDKGEEKMIRKVSEKWAKGMDKKALRIKSELTSKASKLDEKKKKDPSWFKKQADEWKKAFKEVEAEESNESWEDAFARGMRRKRIRNAVKRGRNAGRSGAGN